MEFKAVKLDVNIIRPFLDFSKSYNIANYYKPPFV